MRDTLDFCVQVLKEDIASSVFLVSTKASI